MSFFSQPIFIGTLHVKNRVFLAPLAGVSDVPFRRICQKLGAGLTYVEMLSATAIHYESKNTFAMMARHNDESILGVQVTGPTAGQVAHAVSVLDKKGFDTIDINMGCPVRKVVNAGCGSAILKEPMRISETVSMARKVTTRPLSTKFRLGYTRENVNVVDTVQRVIQEHTDMLTVHGRTRSESYSTPCDLLGIKTAIETAKLEEKQIKHSVVKVGNGDIFCCESALKMQLETCCDAVMVSRGALGNPWIFSEIVANKPLHLRFDEWFEIVMLHLSYQEEFYGNNKLAAVLARKHLLWYAKGFPGIKVLREKLNTVESLHEARQILHSYFQQVPKNCIRYDGSSSEFTSSYDPKYEMDRNHDRGVGTEGLVAL